MKILILGKGYIGTALSNCLNSCYEIVHVNKQELDYTNRQCLYNYITKTDIKLVINTCGYTGRPNVDACEADKHNTWYYNVTVPVNIQKVCKDTVTPMIHISSGCIYDGYEKDYTEEDEPNFGLSSPDSSWYSKTKHACELMMRNLPVYTFRIRMPFCSTWSERNIITKLLKYDNIIDEKNSLTNVEDLCGYILYFLSDLLDGTMQHKYGIYNVVNPQPVLTSEIIELMKQYGLVNNNWKNINLDTLYKSTVAKRSNCVLSDFKITNINLKLPETKTSLKRCIAKMATTRNDQQIQRFTQQG